MSNRELFRFLVITFAVAFVGQLIVIRQGLEGPARLELIFVMWMPALAAFLAGAESRRRVGSALRVVGAPMLLPALLLGWSFTILQSILLVTGPWASWNSELFPLVDGEIRVRNIHLLLGGELQSVGSFSLNWTTTLIVGSALSTLPALGEELGWRAVLQPELERRLGPFAATVVVGLLWGYWHLPINLGGANDAAHPIVNALIVFPLLSVLLAFPFAWLWRETRSVWPPAVCHGAGDAILGGLLLKANSWPIENISLVVATVLVALPFLVTSWRADRYLACKDRALG